MNKESCPNCFSYLKAGACPNCGYNSEFIPQKKIPGVWKFIICFASLQFVFKCFMYVAKYNYSLLPAIISSTIEIVFAWGVLLLIPCIIRYKYKKLLSKKQAIKYTVISSIILIFFDIVIAISIKLVDPNAQTTTVWNLLMMIVPYYLLSDRPIFSFEKKEIKNIEETKIQEESFETTKEIKNEIKPERKKVDLKEVFKNNRKIIVIVTVIVGLLVIYQLFFRYEYKTYKGSLPYTAEVVKIDKLTGQSSIKILNARSNKK